jgi:dipeptidyl aminopeptidase/acylaminoacyl peptidase
MTHILLSMNTLQNCPLIISSEKMNFDEHLALAPNKELVKKIYERLARVDVYRIVYKVNELQVVGFVAYPKEATDLPCVISLRGGNREFSKITPGYILRELVSYADRGYVLIATQYPGVDGGTGLDIFGGVDDLESIKKLKDILDWIPQADGSLIGIKGHSRGGLMVYMMLREVGWIQAAIVGASPTDEFESVTEREDWRDLQVRLYGGSEAEVLRRSPRRWVADLPKDVPILILHGSSDWRVSPLQSIRMSEELYKHKVPHRFILFEGADHGIWEFKDEYRDQTLSWLQTYLKKDRVLPDMTPHGK